MPLRRPGVLVAAGTSISALLIVIALLLYVRTGGDDAPSRSAGMTSATPRATSTPTPAPTARIAPTIVGLKLSDDPEAPARATFPVTDRLFACFAAQGGTAGDTLTLIVTADGLSAPPADGGIVARSLPVAQTADHACYRLDVVRPPITPGPYQVMIVLGNTVLARAPFNALPPSAAGSATATAIRSATATAVVATPAASRTPAATATPAPPTAVATPAATPQPTIAATPPPPPATPTVAAPTSPPPTAAPPTPAIVPPTLSPTPVRTVPPPALDEGTPRPPPIPPAPTVRPPGTPAG